MLKHRNIVAFFILGIISLILLNLYFSIHLSVYIGLLLIFLGLQFYGAYYIHSGFHLKAICSIKTEKKVIALSFDDGPAAQTEKILELLEEFDVTASFFCIGNRIQGNEEILKKTVAKGHIVGNHSYSHGYWFDLKTTKALVEDLKLANKTIYDAIGHTPAFFRPPYGVTTPGLARATKKLNLEVIGWNIRSLDTSIKDPKKVLLRIQKRLQPGSILLMHDTIAGTEIALRQVLIYLKEQNYQVISLDKLIQKKAYA